jgi:hypothetical protein
MWFLNLWTSMNGFSMNESPEEKKENPGTELSDVVPEAVERHVSNQEAIRIADEALETVAKEVEAARERLQKHNRAYEERTVVPD